MPSQLLMSTLSSTLSQPKNMDVMVTPTRRRTEAPSCRSLQVGFVKCPYNVDQQVKLLHLQAEVDTLLLQLQTIKQQRLTTPLSDNLDSDLGRNHKN